jgi:hypothetical protein
MIHPLHTPLRRPPIVLTTDQTEGKLNRLVTSLPVGRKAEEAAKQNYPLGVDPTAADAPSFICVTLTITILFFAEWCDDGVHRTPSEVRTST